MNTWANSSSSNSPCLISRLVLSIESHDITIDQSVTRVVMSSQQPMLDLRVGVITMVLDVMTSP